MRTSEMRYAEGDLVLRRGGQRGLFIVEVGSPARERDVAAYFAGAPCEVRMIATGPVVACAARAPEDAGDLLERMAAYLRGRHPLSICEPGFTASLYRVAVQLARDSEGRLHPLEACAHCAAPEPFPSALRLQESDRLLEAHFCEACIGAMWHPRPEDTCRALLREAGPAFRPWQGEVTVTDAGKDGVWHYRVARTAVAGTPSA